MALVALLLGVAAPVLSLPTINSQALAPHFQVQTWFGPQLPPAAQPPQKLCLPIEDPAPVPRGREIEEKRRGFLYGPSLLGNSSFFPSGILGNAMAQQHQNEWYTDAAWLAESVNGEAKAAMLAITQVRQLSPQLTLFY